MKQTLPAAALLPCMAGVTARGEDARFLHGAQLARMVRFTARDGYRVSFSLAELDPTPGNARVFVVDACDGKPLRERDGPLRLLVPDDQRPARGVRQLQSVDVVDVP